MRGQTFTRLELSFMRCWLGMFRLMGKQQWAFCSSRSMNRLPQFPAWLLDSNMCWIVPWQRGRKSAFKHRMNLQFRSTRYWKKLRGPAQSCQFLQDVLQALRRLFAARNLNGTGFRLLWPQL